MDFLKFVIADSDAPVRLALRRALEAWGASVPGEAETPRQAVALCRALRPDVAILGVGTPDSESIDAARRLREDPDCAVILLHAAATLPFLERANAAGVVASLSRPLESDALQAAVLIGLGRHQERRMLQTEIASLQETLYVRKTIGRAKSLLMARHQLSEREAFERIQQQSQRQHKPAHEIAQAIVTASELGL